ncbi:MAG: hypothetical protein U0V49_12990 [Saprospiraceae bacterium]
MNILIADAGSTKTEWVMVEAGKDSTFVLTPGINPSTQSRTTVWSSIQIARNQLNFSKIDKIEFYGAGCRDHAAMMMSAMLKEAFQCEDAFVHSDLLGAARAGCQGQPGIIGILGTGSNSGLCNGHQITQTRPALGYLLGDEGSGNYYGKLILKAYYYQELDPLLCCQLEEAYPQIKENYLSALYSMPMVAAELASFFPWIAARRSDHQIKELIHSGITDFIKNRIQPLLKDSHYPIYLAGSVAFQLKEEYRTALRSLGIEELYFIEKPLKGLIRYHEDYERD